MALTLATLASAEASVREHFGGFREHTAVLASAVAGLVAVLEALPDLPIALVVLGSAVAFALAALALRHAYRGAN